MSAAPLSCNTNINGWTVKIRKVDLKKREEGAWVTDIPEYEDWAFKVRGMNNKDWMKRDIELTNKLPRDKRTTDTFEGWQERRKIVGRLLFETCLLDWRNIQDPEGNDVPYSRETAEQFCTDPDYEEVRAAVAWAASQVEQRGQTEIEEDAKN